MKSTVVRLKGKHTFLRSPGIAGVSPAEGTGASCGPHLPKSRPRSQQTPRLRPDRRRSRIQPCAVVPQNFSALFVIQRQAKELMHGIRECAIGMRVVGGHHKIIRAQFFHHIDCGFFIGIQRDVTLPLEVFAGRHAQLKLTAGAVFLPLVIQTPQPPVDPPCGAF